MFRDFFKYYKSKNPPPNYENVIDVNSSSSQVRKLAATYDDEHHLNERRFGLKSLDSWEIYEFSEIPGLIFVRNPFTPPGQRYWITRCLRDYSRKPNRLNIDAHEILGDGETWWDVCRRNDQRSLQMIPKLRWATLGYHHNWDTKHYTEDDKTEIPEDLKELTGMITKSLGFHEFTGEAAIINYYRMNSTLAGHVDHSEDNVEAPLVSVSFGQTALFLIGGLKQEDPASAIFLHSGDVLVMSGSSRLRYHGVPRILKAGETPWDDEPDENFDFVDDNDWSEARKFIIDSRINMNVRQVLNCGQKELEVTEN